ncbi:AbrB/MazE/SpoVT family DNA-binding domain-containing protein [Dehalococcoidia bacterium]|nr:AbrB/MazE/SpoVT family DNA-binding domain-containing protein [Dehalococcoidia bacterium]
MPKMTIKGQITIPGEVRDSLGLKPGSRVRFRVENGSCILEKDVENIPFGKWIGYLSGDRTSDEIIEELRGN